MDLYDPPLKKSVKRINECRFSQMHAGLEDHPAHHPKPTPTCPWSLVPCPY